MRRDITLCSLCRLSDRYPDKCSATRWITKYLSTLSERGAKSQSEAMVRADSRLSLLPSMVLEALPANAAARSREGTDVTGKPGRAAHAGARSEETAPKKPPKPSLAESVLDRMIAKVLGRPGEPRAAGDQVRVIPTLVLKPPPRIRELIDDRWGTARTLAGMQPRPKA